MKDWKNKITSTNSVYLDVQDRKSTIEMISKTNPELVIICNALTGVDLCEENPRGVAKYIYDLVLGGMYDK